MKIRYLKLKNWLLVSLAGLLGLPVACDNPNEIISMYACPSATYHVKGTVTNEKGQPLAGIDVDGLDTTGTNGRYNITVNHFFPGQDIPISFRDIDGAENGSYKDTIVDIKTEGVELTGGDGEWNHGEGTVTQDIIMEEKTNK